MAAGSQAENGTCALLVIAATVMVNHNGREQEEELIKKIFHESIFNERARETRRRTSPIRLVNAVIRPAPQDLWFL